MGTRYKRYRFPVDIIRHCVWLYYSFPLSYRDIEKMMLYRSIEVTYETVRNWCQKFAQDYANQIRKRRRAPVDKWHLDEVVVTIKGGKFYLWRAVDAQGQVIDILMQRRRNKVAAKKFFRKLLKSTGSAPRVIVTDKMRSYAAAKRELIPSVQGQNSESNRGNADMSQS